MRQVDEPERERRRADDLSRFAYTPTLSSPRPPRADSALVQPARVVRKDPPDPQLAQLSKCIGCGLQWTRRKTAKQKHTHIGQCAKKNGLSKDTVRILVETEISQDTASSHIPAHGPNENATTTLMDSVVPLGPLKKPKRQQVVPTVRSLPETRESILHRARDILGPTKGQAEPLPTHQFGSALARRNTQQPKCPTLLDLNRSMQEPPSTQPFGASSLRGGTAPSERSVDGCGKFSSLPIRRFSVSMFAQDSVSSSDCQKRPASPPPLVGSHSRTVRRRLLQ